MAERERPDPATVPVTSLRGVGPVRARALERLGLRTLRDVLLFPPRRLETSVELAGLDEVPAHEGERVRVRGTVRSMGIYRRGWRRSVLRVRIEDELGHADLLFFNQAWMRKRLTVGDELRCEGLAADAKGPAVAAPRLLEPEEERPTALPVYALTEGVGQDLLRGLCRSVCEEWADALEDPLPAGELARLGLPTLADASRAVHLVEDEAGFALARRRLGLEALLGLQARLAQRRAEVVTGRATPVELSGADARALAGGFPAPFTSAQERVTREIARDLARTVPMRRLLQGDVGSGKTWVGAFAAAAVARAGGQVALMAPTELLAEQHAMGLVPLFESLGLQARLLVGSLAPARAREVREELADGRAAIAIGTHALLSETTRFRDLALAIVDEQHRFGVAQRRRLLQKGGDVHALLMTATPIPRTLALTVYGDLETSLLDERPPGRGSIATRRVPDAKRSGLVDFLVERLRAGERVFWVAPRIDGSRGAEAAAEAWSRRLTGTGLGAVLVHGRLGSDERARRVERFRSGEAGLLVGTTIVEVGVDVPEATCMVIDGAHQLGLAQLHQLRGRVGRGSAESWCFLLGDEAASERMDALVRTDDGFELAEEDLRQRGMGTLTGARQAGRSDEGLDDPMVDLELVLFARRLVRDDPELRALYGAPETASGGLSTAASCTEPMEDAAVSGS